MERDGNRDNLLLMITPDVEWPKLKHPYLNTWHFRFAETIRNTMRAGHKIDHMHAKNFDVDDGFKNWNKVPKFKCTFKLEMYKKINLDGSIVAENEGQITTTA